jgi:drug/metabolite transporter (DMT)-like permease
MLGASRSALFARPGEDDGDELMTAVIAAGLAAALLFALSALLQCRAAREALGGHPSSLTGPLTVLRFVGRLTSSKAWVAGWVTNVVGNGVQAIALKLGSVSAVQPLMSTQLLFAMSFASAEERRWPSLRDISSAVAVCAGLVILLTTEGATPQSAPPHRGRALAMAIGAIGIIAVLRLISRHVTATLASVLSGVSAGLCHAMSAVLIKVIIEDVSAHGLARAALHWPVYALIVSTAGGFVLGQLAVTVASGPLPAAVAAMSATNPVASFLVGMLAFDAPMPRDPGVVAAIAVSGVLIVAGIIGLANATGTQDLYRGDVSGRSRSRCESEEASHSSQIPAEPRTPRVPR